MAPHNLQLAAAHGLCAIWLLFAREYAPAAAEAALAFAYTRHGKRPPAEPSDMSPTVVWPQRKRP